MEVLGFWTKLFTKCVAVADYQILSDEVESLNKNLDLKVKVISDLKDTVASKEERIKDLDKQVSEFSIKYDLVVTELSNEKDKYDMALKLLSNAQSENNLLKQQDVEEPKVPVDEVPTCEEVSTINDIVTSSDKLQNFINGLTKDQMNELKDDILKGHKNDKRLTSTMKNWIKKYPTNLETHLYFMFKTALTRRRGKQQLASWYSKYDNMTK